MDHVTQRITQIIKEKELTNASFADAIGIKRPIISHILSGRNKPSLHVVSQILKTFEDVDARWLVLGEKSSRTEVSPVADTPVPKIVREVSEAKGSADSPLPTTLLIVDGNEFRIAERKF